MKIGEKVEILKVRCLMYVSKLLTVSESEARRLQKLSCAPQWKLPRQERNKRGLQRVWTKSGKKKKVAFAHLQPAS